MSLTKPDLAESILKLDPMSKTQAAKIIETVFENNEEGTGKGQ
jgi:hypothetical protein